MLTSCSTTPIYESKKDNALSNQNNSDPSESSTGESQYKEDINDNKSGQNIYNKRYKKSNNEKKLLNKKVKRLNFHSPNKKQKNNNDNNKINIIGNILQEFKSSFSQYNKYPQFKIIEKNFKNDFYPSPLEFALDFRKIFSNLFLSSLSPLDSGKYEKILIISQIFEQIFQKHEKNSQIKTAQKLSDDLAKLKKEINKLTRKKNIKTGKIGHVQNLEETKEDFMEDVRENILNKISKLNSEQKKGILKIIDGSLINKNGENNFIEFNINNIPIKQLKKLNIYINNCINNNININNNYKTEISEKKEDLIQMDELSSSLSEFSDSLDSESFDLE